MKTTYFIPLELLDKYKKALQTPIINVEKVKENVEKLSKKGKNLTLNINESVEVKERW